MNLEQARAALEALPGVHRVLISTQGLGPITAVKLKVYCTNPDISHEKMQQAVRRVREIVESLERDMNCTVDVQGYGPLGREPR